MMNEFLPMAPPQLINRVNADHWAGFIAELNDAGTPDADLLLSCGIYMSCTCCMFFPKIKAEFEEKARRAVARACACVCVSADVLRCAGAPPRSTWRLRSTARCSSRT